MVGRGSSRVDFQVAGSKFAVASLFQPRGLASALDGRTLITLPANAATRLSTGIMTRAPTGRFPVRAVSFLISAFSSASEDRVVDGLVSPWELGLIGHLSGVMSIRTPVLVVRGAWSAFVV